MFLRVFIVTTALFTLVKCEKSIGSVDEGYILPPIDWSTAPEGVEIPDYKAPDVPGVETWVTIEKRFHPERFLPGGLHYNKSYSRIVESTDVNSTSNVPESIVQPSEMVSLLEPENVAPTQDGTFDRESTSPASVLVFASLGLGTIFFVSILLYRKSFLKATRKYVVDELELTEVITSSPATFEDKFNPSLLANVQQIAKGQFSIICHAIYATNRSVAIKRAKSETCDFMRNELDVLLAVGQHKNIVSLIGSYEEDDSLCVVLEYSYLGDLSHYLSTRAKSVTFTETGLYEFYINLIPGMSNCVRSQDLWIYCNQILQAMLHLADRKIIHSDVAARNVLVFHHNLVKLTDFGLSHVGVKSRNILSTRTSSPLPIAWMPPEVLQGDIRQFSPKTDVWSFGVFMWEVFSFGDKPYNGIAVHDIYDHVKQGLRLPKPDSCTTIRSNSEWYDLMQLCWLEDPEDRPTFKQIQAILKNKNLQL